uniref:Peptidase S1 domain-containing protein n=1 Tax=Glossina brevipalpis TaxID=37001 RepID=A0A1A9W1D5_9MUSC
MRSSQHLLLVIYSYFLFLISEGVYSKGIATTVRSLLEENLPSSNVLPKPPHCGPDSLGDKLLLNNVVVDQYPWMALLGFKGDEGVEFLCGGNLINQRYVLTVAHCVDHSRRENQLSKIRLGEYDLNQEIDCVNSECNEKPVDINIEAIIVHPNYNVRSHHNDIALIRLAADVNYTRFIQPVCLPLPETRTNVTGEERLTVASWGRLDGNPNGKTHMTAHVVEQTDCANMLRKFSADLITSQICASTELYKGNCIGASGDPLMRIIDKNSWFLTKVKCGVTVNR